MGFHQGCCQIGWQLIFADKPPWRKISEETNLNSFNLRGVRGGKCQQDSKIVCRDHLCFFSTKILWQKCVICCQTLCVQTDNMEAWSYLDW